MSYQVGDGVRIRGVFKDVAKQLTDPTTISLTIIRPNGTVETIVAPNAAIVRDSLGKYHTDLVLDQSGQWSVRFYGLDSDLRKSRIVEIRVKDLDGFPPP